MRNLISTTSRVTARLALTPRIQRLKMSSTPPITPSPSPSQLPQTFENAKHLLSLLPTNKDVTSLFAAPASSAADLNAAAIPEMRAWLARAGLAPDALAASGLRCVHVAGTKGKGSTSAFVAALLRASGATGPVGLYTSPHVLDVRERIALDGRPVGKEAFARAVFEVWGSLTEAARREGRTAGREVADAEADGPGTKPFYFRFLTLVALRVFAAAGVRSAVVECGIGGEHDATNALPAEAVTVAVVTQLGLDHERMLGGTVGEIAWHKAGIFKEGVVAVTLQRDPPEGVMGVLRDRADEKRARGGLQVCDSEKAERWKGVQNPRLLGPFQKGNMYLALHATRHHLLSLGHAVDWGDEFENLPKTHLDALAETHLRGRGETLGVPPYGDDWLFDGAHTADSLEQVAKMFFDKPKVPGERRVLVFGQQERDTRGLLGALVKGAAAAGGAFDSTVFAELGYGPQARPGNLEAMVGAMKELSPSTECRQEFGEQAVSRAMLALEQQCVDAQGKCRVLVTGSFHLVHEALEHAYEKAGLSLD
jgi:folylpolyglutamate synthase